MYVIKLCTWHEAANSLATVGDYAERVPVQRLLILMKQSDKVFQPPYDYWLYHLWANMASLNHFRQERGFSEFQTLHRLQIRHSSSLSLSVFRYLCSQASLVSCLGAYLRILESSQIFAVVKLAIRFIWHPLTSRHTPSPTASLSEKCLL